jgi:hypothetical protein
MELTVKLRKPHSEQARFINSPARRKVVKAGRRGGKTTGLATMAVQAFLAGKRVLYAVPTDDQVGRFWFEVKRALTEPLSHGIFYKNETKHIIEIRDTEQRIRAKTAWNADTLRGDYADLLILDEYQMMDRSAWEDVGAPMLLDNDGDAVFAYTIRRGKKGQHAQQLFKKAQENGGRWAAFTFASHVNPHLSTVALDDITSDMTRLAYQAEILAQDIDDDPRALWGRDDIEPYRVTSHPDLTRVVVGVDPPGSASGAECGIVAAGKAKVDGKWHGYIIADDSLRGKPERWAKQSVSTYNRVKADRLVGEVNNGGDMIEHTIRTVPGGRDVAYKSVRASRGKAIRAEPVLALFQQGRIHPVGEHPELEDQMCQWVPGEGESPDRLDALVWSLTELMLKREGWARG